LPSDVGIEVTGIYRPEAEATTAGRLLSPSKGLA
jgi:hypothetical protein